MSEKRRVSTRKRRRRCEKKRYLNIGYSHVIDLKRQERRQTNKQTNKEKNELSVGDSNPGLSRDRRRYLTNYTNRDF